MQYIRYIFFSFQVLLQLKDRLGRSWRDVARHLNIRECEIDTVENRYPSLKEQCYQVRLCMCVYV